MPRSSRIVVPGVAHHVTQRGNRRQQTFFSAGDYARYRDLAAEGCRRAGVTVLAWCLMPNHVHLILVPQSGDGLRAALGNAHRDYAWTINRRNGWHGHLWQERFHSFPMDDAHLLAAVRYVELNPVRARLVPTPEAWPWSSAATRCTGKGDPLVSRECPPPLDAVANWRWFLAQGLDEDALAVQRRHQHNGKPLGGEQFICRLENATGKNLAVRSRGRPNSPEHGGASCSL